MLRSSALYYFAYCVSSFDDTDHHVKVIERKCEGDVNSSDPIRREFFNIQMNGVVSCDGVADFLITQDAFMETKAGIPSWIVENHQHWSFGFLPGLLQGHLLS